MASTNFTTYYELPQYVSTDKPTYLTDFNQAMAKIDAAIHVAKAEADTNASNIGDLTGLNTSAKSTLVAAINEVVVGASSVGSLTNLTTSDKTSIVNALNEVNGKANTIGSLLDLETTSKTSIVSAINEVKAEADTNASNIDNFNLTEFTTLDNTGATPSITSSDCALTGLPAPEITIASNSDGSIAKVYGFLSVFTSKSGTIEIEAAGSGLAPTEEFSIQNAGLIVRTETNGQSVSMCNLTFKTNGNILITLSANIAEQWINIFLLPMLYYIKNFGDVVNPIT